MVNFAQIPRMKPTFTIIIPTHNHTDTLWYSVQSVLQQTRQDFEIFIVGDGVPERTRDIVAAMMRLDPRISFFDNPKGQRHGEIHRHEALKRATGGFVCYQADDDLWFPNHLEVMAKGLANHDLVHAMRMSVTLDGQLDTSIYDANVSATEIDRMRRSEAGFGLCAGAHRLDAYRRLPQGWHPTPAGFSTDLYFWLQFLDQPWCRYQSIRWPTSIHFSSVTRKDVGASTRIAELAWWWPRVMDKASRNRMHLEIQKVLGNDELPLQMELAEAEPLTSRESEMTLERNKLQTELAVVRHNYALKEYETTNERDALRREIAELRNSQSWRVTAPLRLLLLWINGGKPIRKQNQKNETH